MVDEDYWKSESVTQMHRLPVFDFASISACPV